MVSESDERPGASLPTEQIPAVRAPDRDRRGAAGADPLVRPVDADPDDADDDSLPEIVPADPADRGRSARSGASDRDDRGREQPARTDHAADRSAVESPRLPVARPAETTGPGAIEAADAPSAWQVDDAPPLVVATPAPAPNLRVTGRRQRVRRVTRTVRHVDPWSVFKLGVLLSIVVYGVTLTSGVLLWNVASRTGTVDNVERWFTQFGWETFELNGGEIFHNAWIGGLFAAVGLTGLFVFAATVFNLVSDIVGGIRVTVLEDDVVERTASSTRRYVVQRPVTTGAPGAATSGAWPAGPPTSPRPGDAPGGNAGAGNASGRGGSGPVTTRVG